MRRRIFAGRTLAAVMAGCLMISGFAGCTGTGGAQASQSGSSASASQSNADSDSENSGGFGSTINEIEELDMSNLLSFELSEVVQEDEYCENALSLEIAYLTSLDADRLLAGFRETAGLDMKGANRYGGWENSLIGGHTMGHYLSALAQAYANAGTSGEDKEKLGEIIDYTCGALLECQENSKGKEGFIFGATILDENNVELQFDNVESNKTNITTQAWVPWYTMHKILAGLIEVYELNGNEDALTVAKGLGKWVYERSSTWTQNVNKIVLSIEYGGMNDALYELYAITGEDEYAIAGSHFDEDFLYKRVANGLENALNDLHANTTIPKFIGALNKYIATNGKVIGGETVDASAYLEYAKAFWDMVVERHTYVTGANSEWEHFGKDYILDAERTNCNNETCNVYNMLKLSRMLYEVTGDAKYMDYYENAFINSILSSQNPESGMTTYFQPMATGYFKVYSTAENSFWCCTGSGMENFTKINDSIYFHKDDTLYVNMYFTSEVKWEDAGITLKQEANIPNSDVVRFTISGADVDGNIAFRLPSWLSDEAALKVNGNDVSYSEVSGYAVISDLKDGDVIELTLPMEVKAYSLPDDESAIAFKYGPMVLSADLGCEDEKTTTTGVSVTIPALKIVESEEIVLPDGVSREDLMENANDYFTITDSEGAMAFALGGSDLVYNIHYLRYKERYGVYFYFKTQEEIDAKESAKKRSEDTVVDTVQPGYGQYESDELHNMTDGGSVGVTNDGTYRYASEGGYFTYMMAVDEEGDNYLSLTLRAEDNGKSLLIKSGDTVLFEDVLDYIGLDEEYELRVYIPVEVKESAVSVSANGENHKVIPVTFSGTDGAESARICNFVYMLSVVKLYTPDPAVAYFVDCGDYDVTTVSEGDAFGVFNSVTEQIYGYDPVTGMKWGLIDDANDMYGGSANNDALYTAHTWAYEFNDSDGLSKTASNRYTKNQYEDGITPRYLDYAFELEDGEYTVEIGFSNPWNCSNMHDVYANIGTDNEQVLATGYNVSKGALTAKVTVKGGKLTLNFRNATSSGLAINVSYIKITF